MVNEIAQREQAGGRGTIRLGWVKAQIGLVGTVVNYKHTRTGKGTKPDGMEIYADQE